MPQYFEPDEFDRASAHGGRHRIRRTGSVRVREWLTIFAVTAVVTGVGFYGFKIIGETNTFAAFELNDTVAEPQLPSPEGLGVMVVDASGKEQLATKVASKLLAAGFNVQSARNLDALTNPGGTSSTVVYYQDPAQKDTADKVAKELGGLTVNTSDKFDSAITVVLGTRFAG